MKLRLAFLLCLVCYQAVAQQIEVYFSPQGGCTEAIVGELDAAKATVLVQAYSFTSVPIAKALVNADHRGVRIEVILDKSRGTGKYSEADFLQHAGIFGQDGRSPQNCPQQSHSDRRLGGYHWVVQLHEASRDEQRRESACDSR